MKASTVTAVLFLLSQQPADAALAPATLDTVALRLPPDAAVPLNLSAPDASGNRLLLRDAFGGRPGFLLFTDYTCKTLCGPALAVLGAALERTSMPAESYRVVVVGIDPKDSAAEARTMLDAEMPQDIRQNIVLLLPDAKTLAQAAAALGFHYVYDKTVDQFAHPEVAYVIRPDGRVGKLLSPFALTTTDLRAALALSVPDLSLYDRVRLICYRFGTLHGIYTPQIETALRAASAITLILIAGGWFALRRRGRRAP